MGRPAWIEEAARETEPAKRDAGFPNGQDAAETLVDDAEIVSVKLSGTIAGVDVWLCRDEAAVRELPDDALPAVLFSEVEALRGKSPEQLRAILAAKTVFRNGHILK